MKCLHKKNCLSNDIVGMSAPPPPPPHPTVKGEVRTFQKLSHLGGGGMKVFARKGE